MKIPKVDLLIKSLGATVMAEVIGAAANMTSLSTWYLPLKKPALVPPGYVFGIVWGILYPLMGVALYLVWRTDKTKTKWAVRAFFLQLALNIFWSIYFFGFRSPFLGFVDITLMILAILWTVVLFFRHSKVAAYLMLPYLLWVIFATYLNWSILLLNP